MSVDRIWRWLCNVCSETVDLSQHGLPQGWMIFHRDGETMHACTTCAPTTPGAMPPSVYGGQYCKTK